MKSEESFNGTITWERFRQDANTISQISKSTEDYWQLVKKSDEEGQSFLKLCKKITVNYKSEDNNASSNLELLNMEYHIVYNISYQVPVLFFSGSHCDGSLLTLEQAWPIFIGNLNRYSNMAASEKKLDPDMLSILTQMDHPILFKPCLGLHPCRTAEVLSCTPNSKNIILTFLSIYGPYVNLNLDEIGSILS